jgi:hypothetical protein
MLEGLQTTDPPDLIGWNFTEAVKVWEDAGFRVVANRSDSLPHQRFRIIRQRLIAPNVVAVVVGEELYSDPL